MEWNDAMSNEQRGIPQDGLEADKMTCSLYESLIFCMDPVEKNTEKSP